MGKPDEDIVEKAFVVRSYGKGELASMYIDGVQQQLQETGMAPTARRYTPAQVRLIIGVLGTP